MKFLSKDPTPPAPEQPRRDTSREGRNEGLNAFLGEGCRYQGKLAYDGTVRIDGQFSGEILSEGTLIIGEGAEVKAEIRVATVVISGRVLGNIIAKDKLELKRTAVVNGTIFSPVLKVAEGGTFEGNCRMGTIESASHAVEAISEQEARVMALEPLTEGSGEVS